MQDDTVQRTLNQSYDRGQSPVLGTILLVAIAVILGAIIATLSLSIIEDSSSGGPQIVWDTEEEPEEFVTNRPGDASIQFTHLSGDIVTDPNDKIIIKYDGAATFSTASDDHLATDVNSTTLEVKRRSQTELNLDGDLKAGEKINVTLSCCRGSQVIGQRSDIRNVDDAENGDVVTIVWIGSEPGETQILARHTLSAQDT